MGASEDGAISDWGQSRVNNAQAELDTLNSQLAELGTDAALTACSAVPGAGIACDFASLGVSVSRGDWLGAALDLVGFVPVVGDGIKAGVRGGKILKNMDDVRRALGVAQDTVNAAWRVVNRGVGAMRSAARSAGQLTALRRQAATRYWRLQRQRQRRKLQREFANCNLAACRRRKQQEIAELQRNPYGAGRLPEAGPGKGAWQGQPGHGTFIPEEGTPMADAIAKYNADNNTNLQGVKFEQGFPDFSDYKTAEVEIPNMRGDYVDGRRSNPNDLGDFGQARQAMADRNGGRWTSSMEEGLTWHHNQDGVTMQLVDQDVHAAVAHTGGGSMMRDTDTF